MTHYQDHFGAGQFAGEFHTAENIRVSHVPGDPAIKNVTYAEVHDHFRRRARIDAAEKYRRRKLTRCARLLFVQVIAIFADSATETLIAFFHRLNNIGWAHLVALGFGQRIRADCSAEENAAKEAKGGYGTGHLEENPTLQTIAVNSVLVLLVHESFLC